MKLRDTKSRFEARLLCLANPGRDTAWAFVVLPKDVSNKHPRRGRTTVVGTINGHGFQARLEPDSKLSHWLQVSHALLETSETTFGDTVTFEIMSAQEEPDPEIASDLLAALGAAPEARAVW